MNRKITFMALALLLGSAFAGSCSNNDEPDPVPVPEETLLIRNYTGFAVGKSQHFQNMLPHLERLNMKNPVNKYNRIIRTVLYLSGPDIVR